MIFHKQVIENYLMIKYLLAQINLVIQVQVPVELIITHLQNNYHKNKIN